MNKAVEYVESNLPPSIKDDHVAFNKEMFVNILNPKWYLF